MKAIHIKVISAVIAALFLIAILQLVGGVISDNSNAPQKSEDSFNALMVRISNAAIKHEPGTPEFSSEFVNIVNTSPDIVDLQLEINGLLYYDYPNPQSSDNPERIMQYNGNTRTAQGRVLAVKVSLYAAKPFSIYYRARVSFLLILAGTITAVILIMYLHQESAAQNEAAGNQNSGAQEEPPAPEEEVVAADNDDDEDSEQAETTQEELLQTEDLQAGSAADAESSGGESEEVEAAEESNLITDTAEEEAALLTLAEEDAPAEAAVAEEAGSPVSETESELPESKEEESDKETKASLEERLQNTLTDAGERGEDLSVLILRSVPPAGLPEELSRFLDEKMAGNEVFYPYHGSMAVILKNMPLDQALQKAEILHQECNAAAVFPFIGIASRSGRDISARRLLTEAEQAAAHADSASPVIAFRVDPEKYRKFLEEQA